MSEAQYNLACMLTYGTTKPQTGLQFRSPGLLGVKVNITKPQEDNHG